MIVPIGINRAKKSAEIEFVSRPEFGFLAQWEACLGDDKHPVRNDAMVFASLACKRFIAHSSIENYAQRAEDIGDHIKNNPNSEVANLIVMRCNWFPESEVIGIAHFRRSWCNNLILDYLAAHPWIASSPTHYRSKIRGVGTSLLYFVSEIGVKYNCGAIWGEATQNSCETYQRFFDLEQVQDLLYIPNEKFVRFVELIKEKWT